MSDYFEIDFLDVETAKSGDAIALRYTIGGEVFIHVVDGGFKHTGQKVAEHIRLYYNNPSFIDNVVVTHNDGDHSCGLRTILEEFDVGALWMLRPWVYAEQLINRFASYSNVDNLTRRLRVAYSNLAALEDIAQRRGIPIFEPFQGTQIGAFTVMAPSRALFFDMVVASDKTPEPVKEAAFDSLGGFMVEVAQKVVALVKMAWGDERFSTEETAAENEMSVVQYANLCGKKILLTGDTGRKGLQEVINFAPAAGLILPGIDRFQVPHHGSRRNVTTEILNQLLGPKSSTQSNSAQFTAIVSSAKADEKHPRKAVVRAMHHRGATVVQTEGVSICTSQYAPNRGWTAAVPVPYPEDQED